MTGCYDIVSLTFNIQKAANLGINKFTSLSRAGSESVRLDCTDYHPTEVPFGDGYYGDLVYVSDDFPTQKNRKCQESSTGLLVDLACPHSEIDLILHTSVSPFESSSAGDPLLLWVSFTY